MEDTAHKAADAEIEAFKREVKSVYLQAQTTAQAELDKFLQTFEDEDNTKRIQVEAGELSKDEWQSWRKSKLLQGKRLKITLENMAAAYANADKVAMAALNNRLPAVYAENANFGAWQACKASGLNLSFNLLDADVVQHMLIAGGALFAQPATDVTKAKAWTTKLMRSQLTQGVMLGESIPKIAKRLQNVTNSNYKVAVRTARTAVTGAQNAGRTNSYARAQEMGVKLKQEWLATLDLRTRHSHRRLDGERVEVGKKFSNGCRYPADPNGSYAEIMNCRCTLIAALDGIDDAGKRWSKLPEGMTYKQWKRLKQAENETAKGEKWSEIALSCKVNLKAIGTKQYKRKVAEIFGSDIGENVYRDISHTIKTRNETPYENLYAYDLTTGERIGRVEHINTAFKVVHTAEYDKAIKQAVDAGHKVATLHNHPRSSLPSAVDIQSLYYSGADFGVIACHDGSLIRYTVSNSDVLKEFVFNSDTLGEKIKGCFPLH